MTLELTLTPKSDGEIMTRIKFKMKAPERDTMESIMFATPENNLIDSNPKQPELFNQPVKTVEDKPKLAVKNL